MSPPSPFFQFEADFVEGLRCIPMVVRFKLDTCGVKLKLQHWHQFSPEERRSLVDLPCDLANGGSQYRDHLQALVTQDTGSPAGTLLIEASPPWMVGDRLPEQVVQEADRQGVRLTLEQWAGLIPLQRFALIKLSRPGHENRNFLPACQEFGLGNQGD
ncbi:MAG: nitrate reductase associated protein [Leptolyngbya sp.]|nr:nitrate reductase associated protein [Leptolyngbya sp.]